MSVENVANRGMAAYSHQVLKHLRNTPRGIPVLRFVTCIHYPKVHAKVAPVGIAEDGSTVFRLVPGDFCLAAAGGEAAAAIGDANRRLDNQIVFRKPFSPAAMVRDIESGFASWYGFPFHGRTAADGEVYDMQQLTAAHRTLPFGTVVRVRRSGAD